MKKRSFLAMVVAGGATWLLAKANSQALRKEDTNRNDGVKNYIPEIKPQDYTGLVHKSLEIFTFTTPAMTYHIADPSDIIDDIAKEQGITTPFYDLDTCVRGVLSPKGQYGHLGHLDYQLNIVGRSDDYDYSKAVADAKKALAKPQVAENTELIVDKAQIDDLEKSLNIASKPTITLTDSPTSITAKIEPIT